MPIRITPLRVMAVFTAMTTLLMVFAIQRVPGDERIEVPKPAIIGARAEQPPPADLQKTDRKPLIPVRQIELTRTAPAPDPKPPVTADAPAKRREDANDTTTSAAVIICRKSTLVAVGAGGAVKEIRRGQGGARHGKGIQLHQTPVGLYSISARSS
jgi:hypothetical protein